MPSKFLYSQTLTNHYLGAAITVKAQTLAEFEAKRSALLAKWNMQENDKREKERLTAVKQHAADHVASVKRNVERETRQAEERQHAYHSILALTVAQNHKLNWQLLKRTTPFKLFAYTEAEPSLDHIRRRNGVPEQRKIEVLFHPMRKKRLSLEALAAKEYADALSKYQSAKESAQSAYEQEKREFLEKQATYNQDIATWQQHFEQGAGAAVEAYLRTVMANVRFPEGISTEAEFSYDAITKALLVELALPTPEDISDIIGYKFVASRVACDPVVVKAKDKPMLYESVIQQIALAVVHIAFSSVYIDALVESIVFNGWIHTVNRATGQDYTACILSLRVSRSVFMAINLARIEPKECLHELKALSAGPLSNLAPVKPIMQLNKEDKRFIESVDVIGALNSDTNLASIPWEDFEHLIRQLFAEVFSKEGAEVKVTQTSRDGGVDAIAFDPDPIRGGKFVIQAKRYNNVVHVSACRDLYGTMINEGAVKGILVTTSYFGSDSYEFVKDKPITLIDGSNLVYMLNEHGYQYRIELKEVPRA